MIHDRNRALVPCDQGSEFQDFLRQVNGAPILSAEEEYRLAMRYRLEKDLQAAHALIHSHLRLVVKTAREYLGYRMSLAEMVQEGTLGLMHAVKRFDPDRGARLATYALWWIRAAIHEYILKGWSLVKVATTQIKRHLFFKLRQAKADGAPLNRDEAAELADKFHTDVQTILEMDSRLGGPDESLNRPVLEGSGEVQDLLIDQRPNQELQALEGERQTLLAQAVSQGLASLDPRERLVVAERLMSDQPATLESLGERLVVSRERVRQLEKRALKKLRQFFRNLPEGQRLVLAEA
ncbi:MAG: RNA polymerase factor sigma-32 [Magnetococcales bacterium]|nr:RNA polymerase factor sigma-32 [Magnetococcales bacterium]